ncbi:TPA_exp: putative GPI-anchored cell surface glycoprotein [Trichophyton benhamiae CBS 112371]|nr:TPA_exp: putative GPI-anchored cell surface glycoprotein [Trichophyton benhamiae CBS 112371]
MGTLCLAVGCTVAGRRATFDVAHKSSSGEELTWSYASPSPDELAHAGFHYTPTALSPDNTTCFLCERSLDGWEEGDDPFTEHLHFSPECGWAIMMAITRKTSDPAQIEDPTSSKIADARRATFFSWPHDGKRGWLCKTEKMVEAGWYFCPNEESDDLVSCPYCKLSLDGWEPKDHPFDEHYRRSSDCSFFEFSKHPKKSSKSTRAKAVRGSKASRLSTQSNATAVSEAPSVDFDDTMEQSIISQGGSRASKAPKKTTKSKSRTAKTKKEEDADVHNERAITEQHDKETSSLLESPSRGTKRKSAAISGMEGNNLDNNQPEPEPKPKKKRVTSTRTKKARSTANSVVDYAEPTDDELVLEAASKPKRGRKKGSTNKIRKSSIASNTPATSSNSQIPNDDEIDAQLEADLDKDLPVEDMASSTAEKAHSQRRKKSSMKDEHLDEPPKKASTKSTRKKQTSTASVAKLEQPPQLHSEVDVDTDEPVISIPTQSQEDTSPPKRVKQTKAKTTTNTAKSRKKRTDSSNVNDINLPEATEPSEDVESNKDEPTKPRLSKGRSSKKDSEVDAAKTTRSRGPSSQRPVTESLPRKEAGSAKEEPDSQPIGRRSSEQVQQAQETPSRMRPSAQQTPRENGPSSSPQASDAENRPPSSKPSTMSKTQPHAVSQSIEEPLVTKTPVLSPPKGESSSRQLTTADPWEPIDPDEALLPDPTEKEGVSLAEVLHAAKDGITSPEKRMSIEEWIFWNAEKGEEKLRNECERVVGIFEREGGRAMQALNGIECID